jgi:hypothetical protein
MTDTKERLAAFFAEVLTEHARDDAMYLGKDTTTEGRCKCGVRFPWWNTRNEHHAHLAEVLVARLEIEQISDFGHDLHDGPLFAVGALHQTVSEVLAKYPAWDREESETA